jgi:hypothetical protein
MIQECRTSAIPCASTLAHQNRTADRQIEEIAHIGA